MSPADLAPDTGHASRPVVSVCPVCGSRSFTPRFEAQGTPIVACSTCGLVLRSPQPSDAELQRIYSEDYFLGDPGTAFNREVDRLKRATGALYLDEIEAYRRRSGAPSGKARLLEIGSGLGNLLAEAQSRGYDVAGMEYSAAAVATANAKLGGPLVQTGGIESAPFAPHSFDICIMADVLEHTRDPAATLGHVHRLLKPQGVIFLAVPSLDSWSAKAMGRRWIEYKAEHLYYFDRGTLAALLGKTGFADVALHPGRKILSLEYVFQHFDRFPVPLLTPLAGIAQRLLPGGLTNRPITVVASGITALAQAVPA